MVILTKWAIASRKFRLQHFVMATFSDTLHLTSVADEETRPLQDLKTEQSRPLWLSGAWLMLLWLGINLGDRLWLGLDNTIPAWDQSNHLTGSLNFVENILHFPGWREFWQVSTKYPPVPYLAAVPFQILFGKGNDQALLMNLLLTGALIWAVFSLGKRLFNPTVGCYAAAIALLMPRIMLFRLHYITDYALVTTTVVSFTCLTHWYFATQRKTQWLWAIAFGVCLGLALMTKQSCMFFLFVPMCWAIAVQLKQKQWEKILQLFVAAVVSMPLWFGWYSTNFIYLFSLYEVVNDISPAAEGDPKLNTIAAWIYYWKDLPRAVSWVLLLPPIVGLILAVFKKLPKRKTVYSLPEKESLLWLGIYFAASYLIFSGFYNKDTRYIMPYLPIVAVFLGYGLTQWQGKWLPVRFGVLGIAAIAWLGFLFPLPMISSLIPNHNYPNQLEYPHTEMIQTITESAPYLRSNLGVIPGVALVNNHTLNYYGALQDFQVYGRELGDQELELQQDRLSFDWFLTKSGEDPWRNPLQLELGKSLNNDSDFLLKNKWHLPDLEQQEIRLFQRREPLATVVHFDQKTQPIKLDLVDVPTEAIAGQPLSIRYDWSGNWRDLERGMVLLTWSNGQRFWIHDHRFAFGMLYAGQLKPEERGDRFGVMERTATLPPADLPAGTYRLQAMYLDLDSGETYPIAQPSVSVNLSPSQGQTLTPTQLVQLDWLSQLRAIAPQLSLGIKGLEPIFAHVERLNQYDPVQDYLEQVEASLGYRLAQVQGAATPQIKDWYFAKVLAHALQEEPKEMIQTLEALRDIEPNNPFVHAYIAFAHLYQWQPRQAETAIQTALTLEPDIPEFQAIAGVSALMQGKLLKVWSIVQTLKQAGVL